MNALVNSLTKKDDGSAGSVTEKPINNTVSPVADGDDEEDEGFIGERMVDVGIESIKASVLESEIKTIFEANGVEYTPNPALIDDVGQRIVDELELMIRMINPESQYQPEWYDRSDDQTVLAAITSRDDLVSVYRDSLVETYDSVTEDIADAIVEYIVGIVSDHEGAATEHYAAPPDNIE